jgi:hypothetical protein
MNIKYLIRHRRTFAALGLRPALYRYLHAALFLKSGKNEVQDFCGGVPIS